MRNRRLIRGDVVENAGIGVIVLATLIDVSIGRWWDDQIRDWPLIAQEQALKTLLISQTQIVRAISQDDPKQRQFVVDSVEKNNFHALDVFKEEAELRNAAISRGQYITVSRLRAALTILGAVLVLWGKVIVARQR